MTMVPVLVHYNNGHRRGGLMFLLTTPNHSLQRSVLSICCRKTWLCSRSYQTCHAQFGIMPLGTRGTRAL